MKSTLASMSPTVVVGNGIILAALKTYFDGSKSDARFLVLACIAADELTWEPIENAWEKIRKERGNPLFIHMADAMALDGEFSGWTAIDRDYLIDGLLGVFLEFTEHPRLHAFTCTVDLAAHKRLREERNIPSPERLCVRILFPTMLDWYGTFPDPILDVIDVFFDRGEKFIGHIYSDWTSKQIRQRYPVWNLIRTIAPVDMRSVPQLQMADMIAWGRNRLICFSHLEKPWESDPHYATAVRAANTLHGTWKEVHKRALAETIFKDEGYDAIDPQRRAQMAKRSSEAYKFNRLLEKLMKVPHADIKARLDAEKAAKKRKKFRKSSASREAGAKD